jgi:hypothetical protein
MVISKYRASGWDDNLNLVVYFSIVLSAIGVVWLALNDVPAGMRYTTIFLVGIGLMVLSFLFVNEHQRETAKNLMLNPFTTDMDIGVGLYLFGWIVPIILSFVLGLFGSSFNVSQLMIPLSANQVLSEISQSFSVAQAQADPFWQWFITVFTAGSIEEFVFGFVLMLVGVLVAMLLWRLLFKQESANSSKAKWFYTIFGLTIASLVFGGAHKLNGTYAGYMFIVAIVFRFIMNWLLYGMGLFLSFTLGYHQSNNAVWYWKEYGPTATFNALGSAGGIIILVFFALIIVYVFKNIDRVIGKMKELFSS